MMHATCIGINTYTAVNLEPLLRVILMKYLMISVLLLYFLRLCAAYNEMPVYALNFDSQVKLCDSASEAFVDVSELRVDRYNETIAYMDGYIEYFQVFSHNTMVELILEKEASGKYELILSHEIYNFCQEVALGSESGYYSFLKYMTLPDECPFQPGKYRITEMVISTEEMPANSSTLGRYRVHLSFYNLPDPEHPEDKKLMYCLRIKMIIEME